MNIVEAKAALDSIISKSRVHLYKPIQIAEILYKDRVDDDITLTDLETYRTKSKKWRDVISLQFLGTICSSSSKFHDNLFDANAIPPETIAARGDVNSKNTGILEAYIYKCL